MFGALVLATVMSPVAAVTANFALPSHDLLNQPMDFDPITLVTYHKTGTVLANMVVKNCLAGLGFQFNHTGHLALPAVHFIRDPKALVRSAYDYHKVSRETWLHDPDRHRTFVQRDPVVGPSYMPNETYQEYLNRVPFEVGVRAEFLRSLNDLSRMVENAQLCMAFPEYCKQVCLESFTESSNSYQETWSAVLRFLGLDHSYMDCISGYDLLNPNYIGGRRGHVTSPSWDEAEQVYEWFASLDKEFKHSAITTASSTWGCASASLRRVPLATPYADTGDMVVHEEGRADSYA